MLLFIMFLFFKQKTAYEMRISDWSSDVCSSDLTQDQDFRHLLVHVRQLVEQSAEAKHLAVFDADIVRNEVGSLAVGSAVGGDEEDDFLRLGIFYFLLPIGSASCRERDCHYV